MPYYVMLYPTLFVPYIAWEYEVIRISQIYIVLAGDEQELANLVERLEKTSTS